MLFLQTSAEWTRYNMRENIHVMVDKCLDDPTMDIPDDMKDQIRRGMDMDVETRMKMAHCMMMKAHFVDKDGNINKEKIKEEIMPKMTDSGKFDEMMGMCNKKMDTPKMTSMTLMDCMRMFHDKKCGC